MAATLPFECHAPLSGDTFDAIVIGGGVSGLRAAQELTHLFGLERVQVLEARPKIGGRVQQDSSFLPGRQLELGAEFIHGDVNPIVELCEAQGWRRRHIFTWSHGDGGPADGPAPDGGIGYYYLGREQKLLRFDDADADMRVCNEALWALQAQERGAAEKDRRTLRQYLVDAGVPERMLGLACAGYGNTAGGTADTVPVTRAMRYERAWHGDGSELDPDFRLEPSFGVLLDHLSRGLHVETSCPVAAIEANTSGAAADCAFPVTVVTRDGRRLRARRVVLSVPLPVLRDGDIAFSPPLAAAKVAAAQSMSFANGVKIVLKFSRPAWPANCHGVVCADSLIPEMWMNSSVGVGGLIEGQVCKYGDDAPGSGRGGSGSSGGDVASLRAHSSVGIEDEVTSVAASTSGASAPAEVTFTTINCGRGAKGTGRCYSAGSHSSGSGHREAAPEGTSPPLAVGSVSSASVGDEALDADADAAEEQEDYGDGEDDGDFECDQDEDEGEFSSGAAAAAASPTLYIVTGFIMGVRADALLAENSQALIIARMLSQLDAMFGLDPTAAFIDGFVHDWSKEEFIRGAYSTPTVREHADASRRLAEPHLGLVFFAGEATAGTVEGRERELPQNSAHFAPPIVLHGAINTGSRAACEVARSLGIAVTCVVDGSCDALFAPSYANHNGCPGYEHLAEHLAVTKSKNASQPSQPTGAGEPARRGANAVVPCEALRQAALRHSTQPHCG